jgi:lipopolysaccharide/colanic/teichoic acid biosynthesis glycosyltransferase
MTIATVPRDPEVAGGVSCGWAESANGFWAIKRLVDLSACVFLLPFLIAFGLALLLINPMFNKGPLVFAQRRMGRNGTEFTMWKFRTMVPASEVRRGPCDPVERHRITPLGGFLRRLRLDEFPQIVNVLCGEMSMIGPRPDVIDHARDYLDSVPSYRGRHAVRPGISGYAQVRLGYTEGHEMAESKAQLDLFYITNAGWRLEAWILLNTVRVMLSGYGAR